MKADRYAWGVRFALFSVVFSAFAICVAGVAACTASTRQTTLKTTLAAADAAEKAWHTYDVDHQVQLHKDASDDASGVKAVQEFRAGERADVEKLFKTLYAAIAAANVANKDPNLTGVEAAGKLLMDELVKIGVKL